MKKTGDVRANGGTRCDSWPLQTYRTSKTYSDGSSQDGTVHLKPLHDSLSFGNRMQGRRNSVRDLLFEKILDDQVCQQQTDQGKNKIKRGVVENELAF